MREKYKPELPSKYTINDEVYFLPMVKHIKEYSVAMEPMFGTIVAVRFTVSKIFYDILDDYYGRIYEGVNSTKVFGDSTQASNAAEKFSSAREEQTITLNEQDSDDQ